MLSGRYYVLHSTSLGITREYLIENQDEFVQSRSPHTIHPFTYLFLVLLYNHES